MAEHDERNFEHEISERLKKLDSNIKIPEIPDAQGIFEKAEEKKTNTIPFKKYLKYVAAAAAVVLICVSVPVMADAFSSGALGMANEEAAEDSNQYVFDGFYTADSTCEETELIVESAEPEEAEEPMAEQNDDAAANPGTTNGAAEKSDLTITLTDYFRSNSTTAASSSAASSSVVDSGEHKEHSADSASSSGESIYGDDVNFIEDYINKKRSIEITIEKDSVSVLLRDNSIDEEMIAAFWVEGVFQSSCLENDGQHYVIELLYQIQEEDLENGYYLPMIGDSGGTYYLSEENVFISEKVTMGVLSIWIEIDVGTGEYQIKAVLM